MRRNLTPFKSRLTSIFYKNNNCFEYNPSHDVAVLSIGVSTNVGTNTLVAFHDGIVRKTPKQPNRGIVGVNLNNLKKFDEVLTGNDVFIFGYPTSLGIKQVPQLDYLRPLLRRGIVAGKNQISRTMVLDCPVYHGNSGAPVVEVESVNLTETAFRVVGVVTQWIPSEETWVNVNQGYSNSTLFNSGYSIAEPIDFALELLWP